MSKLITLRNPERRNWMTGWGVINRAMGPMCDSIDDRDAPIHLFLSPPYSFQDVDPTKFNVGMTMCEKNDLLTRQWHGEFFVPLCNKMDLILVPGEWQKAVFELNKMKPPIEIVTLGHDHNRWKQSVRPGKSTHCLIVDRGRDHGGAANEAQRHFTEVTYMDARTPSQKTLDRLPPEQRTHVVAQGKYTAQEMQEAYRDADVFFKWGREGFCYPILEAMSAGCLIITNCHTLPYIKKHENALVFRDVKELSACLTMAEKNPLTKLKMSGQATAAALTWANTHKETLAAILKHYKTKA